MKEDRKVQGKQFYVTLPLPWRQGNQVEKGDTLDAHYTQDSVLVFAPRNRVYTQLEETIINLLIHLPSWEDAEETVETLRSIVKQLEA